MDATGGRLTNNPHRTATALAGAFAASALLLAACGTNTYATSAPKSNVDLMPRVQRDPGLYADIVVEGARIDDKAGNKVAQVTLRNTGQSDRTIRYRIDWFDQQGSRVNAGSSPWKVMAVPAGDSKEIMSAGGPAAFDFRVSLQSN